MYGFFALITNHPLLLVITLGKLLKIVIAKTKSEWNSDQSWAIYIDIVNIINIINIDIEIGLKKILIFILSQGSISIYVHIGIDIE